MFCIACLTSETLSRPSNYNRVNVPMNCNQEKKLLNEEHWLGISDKVRGPSPNA